MAPENLISFYWALEIYGDKLDIREKSIGPHRSGERSDQLVLPKFDHFLLARDLRDAMPNELFLISN